MAIQVLANDCPKSKENQENTPFKIEDFLDKDDEGRRLLVVMPGSIGDVFMCTSLLKNLSTTYPEYNIYFATEPSLFEILEAFDLIESMKCIQ